MGVHKPTGWVSDRSSRY